MAAVLQDGLLQCPARGGCHDQGLYELVRNWRIGSELAGDSEFVLVNLAPTKLEADTFETCAT